MGEDMVKQVTDESGASTVEWSQHQQKKPQDKQQDQAQGANNWGKMWLG